MVDLHLILEKGDERRRVDVSVDIEYVGRNKAVIDREELYIAQCQHDCVAVDLKRPCPIDGYLITFQKGDVMIKQHTFVQNEYSLDQDYSRWDTYWSDYYLEGYINGELWLENMAIEHVITAMKDSSSENLKNLQDMLDLVMVWGDFDLAYTLEKHQDFGFSEY